MTGFWQGLRITIISAVLLFFAWLGAMSALGGLPKIDSAGRLALVALEIVYGAAAIASLWAVWRASWWLRLALVVWGTSLTVAATINPFVTSGATWVSGAYYGIITAGISWLVAWSSETHLKWRRRRNADYISYYR